MTLFTTNRNLRWRCRDVWTKRVIAGMLREDTGRSLGDSGGTPQYDDKGNYVGSTQGYGRHYERNRLRAFDKEPLGSLVFTPGRDIEHDARDWELSISLSLYHYLASRCSYEADLTRRFHRFSLAKSREHDSWRDNALDYVDMLQKKHGASVDEYCAAYTYNEECLLSQDINYALLDIYCQELGLQGIYAYLQIHNGCDARGGFTAPRFFRVDESEFLSYRDATIRPVGDPWVDSLFGDPKQLPLLLDTPRVAECVDDIHWDTYDGGYSWENDLGLESLTAFGATTDESRRGKGVLYIDEHGKGYCPLSGGLLEVTA